MYIELSSQKMWNFLKYMQAVMLITNVDAGDMRVITTLKYSSHYITPTIVNGVPASFGEVPYLVSIKDIKMIGTNKTKLWTGLCGGCLIHLSKVLTAAHCFEANEFYYAKNVNLLMVVAGSLKNNMIHESEDDNAKDEQWRRIKDIKIHNAFHFPSNDIALVNLIRPFLKTPAVNVIPIAKANMDYSGPCRAAGFGLLINKGPPSPILRVAAMAVLPKWLCSQMWEMNMNAFVCTGKSLSDVAAGDSGSPLTCDGTGDPNEDPFNGLLVGVVSGKNFDKSSIYTRVSAFENWIASNKAGRSRDSLFRLFWYVLLVMCSINLL